MAARTFILVALIVRRARQERLLQVAGSLSFTTLLSVVPLLAVSFALFTHFPVVFGRFQAALEQYLLKSLLPEGIARTVLTTLQQFAANASGLTLLGSFFLLAATLALMLTVERALNQIWGVKRSRPLGKRVAQYVLLLALGPPLVGASLWATSYVLGASAGWIDAALPPSARVVLTLGPVALGWLGLACLFYFVPHTRVRKRDALFGGLLASVLIELGKRGFAAYLLKLPTYKALYGAFAVFPMFLLWVYFSWLVTLGAALVAANLGRGSRQGRS